MSGQLAIVLLAAGESKRYGGNKLLSAHPRGGSLLSYVIDQYQAISSMPLTLVTGKYHAQITAALPAQTSQVVYNQLWQEGLAASIACGVNALIAANWSQHISHVMLAVCDTPGITSASLQRLCDKRLQFPAMRIASRCNGLLMAPAIFPYVDLPLLRNLRGDCGAGHLLRSSPQHCIPVDHVEAWLDIDCPQDWKQYTGY